MRSERRRGSSARPRKVSDLRGRFPTLDGGVVEVGGQSSKVRSSSAAHRSSRRRWASSTGSTRHRWKAVGLGAGAVLAAHRGERQTEQCQFANDRGEIDAFVLDRPRLALGRVPLEDLAHLDLERLNHVVQAAATRHAIRRDRADGHDSFGRRLDDQVDVESAVENASLPHLEVG